MNLKPVFGFLANLTDNNNRVWFEKNRAAYEEARMRFEELVNRFIEAFRSVEDFGTLTAKECVFRIHRDVRFSKDKSPYKTNLGASIARGGRKSERLSYYLHLAPHNQTMLAGGLHMPEPDQLRKFRQAINRDAAEFKKIVRAKDFVRHFGSLEGESLATAPQGYPKDHPEIDLLRLKQVVVFRRFTDREVLSPNFLRELVATGKALKPFLDYLNRILR